MRTISQKTERKSDRTEKEYARNPKERLFERGIIVGSFVEIAYAEEPQNPGPAQEGYSEGIIVKTKHSLSLTQQKRE